MAEIAAVALTCRDDRIRRDFLVIRREVEQALGFVGNDTRYQRRAFRTFRN